MLEKYIEDFDPESAIDSVKEEYHCGRSQALRILDKKIPLEKYYQRKIKEAIKNAYPDAYIKKIAQGFFSEGGIADLMVVINGRYFAFEVKRPVLGEPSELQKQNQIKVRTAGGVYEFVVWPQEALAIIAATLSREKREEKWKNTRTY